jgi:hypothetical protein
MNFYMTKATFKISRKYHERIIFILCRLKAPPILERMLGGIRLYIYELLE